MFLEAELNQNPQNLNFLAPLRSMTNGLHLYEYVVMTLRELIR